MRIKLYLLVGMMFIVGCSNKSLPLNNNLEECTYDKKLSDKVMLEKNPREAERLMHQFYKEKTEFLDCLEKEVQNYDRTSAETLRRGGTKVRGVVNYE